MNDMFTFSPTPWELTCQNLRPGDALQATRLLTLLEGEEEEALEEALDTLEQIPVALDVTDLPRYAAGPEMEKRLKLEEAWVRGGCRLTDLEENDPLRLYLEDMAITPAWGDPQVLAMELLEEVPGSQKEAAARNALVSLSLSKVVELAGEYTGRGVLLLDLIQEGSLGLWNGILAYRKGMDFFQTRDWWIRQYMARTLVQQARASGLGRKMRQALEDYRRADRQLLTQLGHNPTLEEIALEMGVSVEDAQVYQKMLDNAQTLAKANGPQKSEPEEEDRAVEDTAYFQSRQRILDMLSGLTEQEAQVVSLRFGLEGGLPATPEQTGARLGLTASQVLALEAGAMEKLRSQNS